MSPKEYKAIKDYYENLTDKELNLSLDVNIEKRNTSTTKLDFIKTELAKRGKSNIVGEL